MALMIGCIWHGLDALQGTRAKPGNHLVKYIWRTFAPQSCSTGYIKHLTVTAVPFHDCIQLPVPVVQ